MSLPTAFAVALGLALTAYAIFGGADFGAGVLDLLAGARTSERFAISDTIGPLWEANHVWLIFTITLLFSVFPPAFAALGTDLLVPLTVTVIALALRGAALGLRVAGELPGASGRRLSTLFGLSSAIAPVLFGAVAGGLAEISSSATRSVPATPTVPWTGLFALATGGLALTLCGQLAASFIAPRMVRAGQTRLAGIFRRRGLVLALASLMLGLLALGVASREAPALWHHLVGKALAVVLVGLAAIGASAVGFAMRRDRLARSATVLATGAVIWGWLVAQSPHLIGALTIHSSVAGTAAQTAVAIAVGVTLVTVLPAMSVLFGVFVRPVHKETR